MLEGLTPFARRLADHILERYPAWGACATTREIAPGEARELRFDVPRPGQPGPELWIRAWYDQEVTVGFGDWHGHPWLPDDSHDRGIAATLELIDEIVAERLVIGVKLRKGQVVVARPLRPDGEQHWRRFRRRWLPWFDQCYIRSWRGTYDREWSSRRSAHPSVR